MHAIQLMSFSVVCSSFLQYDDLISTLHRAHSVRWMMGVGGMEEMKTRVARDMGLGYGVLKHRAGGRSD